MQTKLLSVAIFFICWATTSYAQTEIYNFKRNPAPFDSKILLRRQFVKPLPFVPNKYKNTNDSSTFSYKTDLGEVFIAPQDEMPILKPYTQSIEYEKQRMLNAPFAKPSYIDPMPNPLKRALIVK